MNKYKLIRKIAVIHAIKCNITLSYDEAVKSNDRLSELNMEVHDANDTELSKLNNHIDMWAREYPIANDSEISRLINSFK